MSDNKSAEAVAEVANDPMICECGFKFKKTEAENPGARAQHRNSDSHKKIMEGL